MFNFFVTHILYAPFTGIWLYLKFGNNRCFMFSKTERITCMINISSLIKSIALYRKDMESEGSILALLAIEVSIDNHVAFFPKSS